MPNLNDYLALDATAMAAGLRDGEFKASELVSLAVEQANVDNVLRIGRRLGVPEHCLNRSLARKWAQPLNAGEGRARQRAAFFAP